MMLLGHRVPMMASLLVWAALWEIAGRSGGSLVIPPLSRIFVRWENGHAVMVHSPSSGRSVTVGAPWTDSWFGGTLRRA